MVFHVPQVFSHQRDQLELGTVSAASVNIPLPFLLSWKIRAIYQNPKTLI